MANRRTIVDDTGDGGAAALVASLMVVALVAVTVFFLSGIGNVGSDIIDIQPPKLALNVAPVGP